MVQGELPPDNDMRTEDLFIRGLRDLRDEEDEDLGALVALHSRPTQDVIRRSLALCSSEVPFERIVGLRVLRELKHVSVNREKMWELIEPTVLSLVRTDSNPAVLQWAISCLGYQSIGQPALSAVLGHVDHEDSRVRFAVAEAIPGLVDPAESDPTSVEALVGLTEDEDADVRSYALMGLVDDLGLAHVRRDVVEARLDDADEQIRRVAQEALSRSNPDS